MSAAGGGLPQRQPRASRRHGAASAYAAASQSAAAIGSDETPVSPQSPQAQLPLPSFSTGGGVDQAVMGAAAHADSCGAAAAAVPDGNATETDGASPAWASDRHTSGALRSAKVDHYDFECEPAWAPAGWSPPCMPCLLAAVVADDPVACSDSRLHEFCSQTWITQRTSKSIHVSDRTCTLALHAAQKYPEHDAFLSPQCDNSCRPNVITHT